MSEDVNLDTEISSGTQAKLLLESATFQGAVNRVQQAYFDEFASADPADAVKLQVIRLKLKALADMVRDLRTVMETGQLAQQQRDERIEREAREKALREGTAQAAQKVRGIF